MKKAYFAGGCFWCIAAAFNGLDGVMSVTEGYSGGDECDPKYADVKHQLTGHREAVCIEYDENVISYDGLLDFFFDNTDPFDGEGQFIDRGMSYTLAIFYQSDDEKCRALQKCEFIGRETGRQVCVCVIPYKNFYQAEEEHRGYAQKHREEFEEEYRSSGRKDFFGR